VALSDLTISRAWRLWQAAPHSITKSLTMTPRRLRRLLNMYPPLLFAGIRVEHVADDWRHARVRLKLRWYNRNYVGTQFGGSLFAMTDPFWMILVMEALGRDYVVWDQAAEISFVAPGREDVYAEFSLDDGVLDELRAATASGAKHLRWFETEVRTARGEVIARVRKQIYVRRKRDRVA
jgi:acyl-coenzyme A thioesterase PaaI-like protein